MSRFHLPRRTFLKGILGGVAATMALPPLEAMLNANGTAFADGSALPTIYGQCYFANGGLQSAYVPTATGPAFPCPTLLQPFNALGIKKYLSVASGIAHQAHTQYAHASQQSWAFHCGTGTTLDQTIAQRWQSRAPSYFPRLDIRAVCHGQLAGQYDAGAMTSGPIYGSPQADKDPKAFFQKVFGVKSVKTGTTALPDGSEQVAVVDIVKNDTNRLMKRLGAADQQRLGTFLNNANLLQTQINTPRPTCSVPDGGNFNSYIPPASDESESITENTKPLCDILAAALACGLTRVFTFLWSDQQNSAIYKEAIGNSYPHGITDPYHGLQHGLPAAAWTDENARYNAITQVVTLTMQHFAYLANAINSYAVGSGTLLDQSLIWATSDYRDGVSHQRLHVPSFFIGKAGGKLKGDYHYASPIMDDASNGDPSCNSSRMGLTALRALGESDTSWGQDLPAGAARGQDSGYTNSPITEFLTGG